MKKNLFITLFFIFSGHAMAGGNEVGFVASEECEAGYRVFFDRTKVSTDRGGNLTISVCGEIMSFFDHRVTRQGDSVYLDVSFRENNFSVPFPLSTYSVPIHLSSASSQIPVTVRFYSLGSDSYGSENFTNSTGERYTQTIEVVSSDKKTKIKDPSGTWYQPSLSGTGFVVMQYENGTVVQYYGYDAEGGRLWLLSDVMDEAWVKGEAKTLTMYEGKADSATGFTTPPVDAPGIEEWGTLELQFDSCSKATAKLQGTDGEQTFELQPLAKPSAVHCY